VLSAAGIRQHWRKVLGVAVGVAALGALAAAATAPAVRQTLREHPYFAIRDVRVSGTGPLLTRTEVIEWLGIRPGMSVWDASPARIRKRLKAHPMIARASVRREFPGRVVISVRERHPAAVLVLDEPFYVDRSGAAFGPLRDEYSRDYPVISGIDPSLPAGARARAVRRALRLARLCDRHACFGGISEVHLQPDVGAVLYPSQWRVPVVLGWGGWVDKVDRAERLFEQWSGETERLASVDARFRNQVVVRLLPNDAAVAKPRSRGVNI
jgi:cell division protein FtsQ